MKILMISTDRKAFERGSDVRRRFKLYGSLVDELHIIIFAKKNLLCTPEKVSQNVFLYPTNSPSKLRYIHDAIKIGKKVGSTVQDVNLVTTQDPFETGIVGVTLARKLKAKLEVQVHTDFLSPFFKKGNIKNMIRVPLGKRVLKKADSIRVVSKRIQNSIESNMKKLSSKITILPVFVDIEKIKQSQVSVDLHKKYPKFNHTTLMMSRLEKEKDIGRVLKVFKEIIEIHPKAGLVIVGDGSERKVLESAAKRLKLAENVIFEGWLEDQEAIASYYKSTDLFLNSSLYEGYGRTLVEALAAGTSVLTTDVGVATEIGADVFISDEELKEKLLQYILGRGKTQFLQGYPYENEEMYLSQLKDSWNRCI